jgi:transcriptional regulator with XRE-family HTH domain
MSERSSRLGELIRRAREDVGMSQEELARQAGTSQTALSAIENGARTPSAELARRILSAARLRPSVALTVFADDVRRLAESHGLSELRVFGSVVRGEDGPDSDVDILARRDPGIPSLRVLAFPVGAAEIIGFPVDLLLDDSRGVDLEAITAGAVPL